MKTEVTASMDDWGKICSSFHPVWALAKNYFFLTTATAAEMSETWRLWTDLKVAEQITSTQTPPGSSTIYLSKSPLSDLSWAPVNWISFRSCTLPDIGKSWWQIGYLTHRYVSSLWFQRLSWQFIEKGEHRQETRTFTTLQIKAASKGREGGDGKNLCIPVKYLFEETHDLDIILHFTVASRKLELLQDPGFWPKDNWGSPKLTK